MRTFKMEVIEQHTDIVIVSADSLDEAEKKAIDEAECTFDKVYDCVLISVDD